MKRVSVVAIAHPDHPELFLHGQRRDNGKWALPGGHANPAETAEEAAVRELREETGLDDIDLDHAKTKTYGDDEDEIEVSLFYGDCPEDLDLKVGNDPDHEFRHFKFLNPKTHGDMHVPTERNILVQGDDDIEKGAMRRLAPFNPMEPEADDPHPDEISMWQDHASQGQREELDATGMSPAAKMRSVHKLFGQTKHRRNPQSGEVEFLLHRGMSDAEFNNYSLKGKRTGKPVAMQYDSSSSWTPHYNIARKFADNDFDTVGGNDYNRITSAWIPSSAISLVPKQYGKLDDAGENMYSHEHEVIVSPHKNKIALKQHLWGIPHSDKQDKIDLHSKIQRGISTPATKRGEGWDYTIARRMRKNEEPEAQQTKLIHFSNIPGLKELDPKMMGSGVRGEENRRGVPEVKRTYFYREGTQPENLVVGNTSRMYRAVLGPEHRLYDLSNDKDSLIANAVEANHGAMNWDMIHGAIRDAGYHGFYNSKHDSLPHVIALYHAHPVVSEHPITPDLRAQLYANHHPTDMKKSVPDFTKLHEKVRGHAADYMTGMGQTLNNPTQKLTVDPQRAGKIAQAYEAMPHAPHDPEVKASYDALINETKNQFKHILGTGIKIKRIPPGMANPYPNGSKDMLRDMHENNNLWYYPTDSGFGSGGADRSDHPMLQPTGHEHDGHELLANDMFRIVHDYFGHAKEGHAFGPNGEENAWDNHRRMYSPLAQKAMTTETRGQNSWVNFGPMGQQNRANPAATVFADQKAGLLPDFAHEAETVLKSEDLEKVQYKSKAKSVPKSTKGASKVMPKGTTDIGGATGPKKTRSFDERVADSLSDLKASKNSQRQFAGISTTGHKPPGRVWGAIPNTVYSYGTHWPMLIHLPEHNTMILNTNSYGGQTADLVNNLRRQLPKFFDQKHQHIIEVDHPDYQESSDIMRGGMKAVIEHLKDNAINHPTEEGKQKAINSLKHVTEIMKLHKSMHDKRKAYRTRDVEANQKVFVDRLNRYLSTIGLSAEPGTQKKGLGQGAPTRLVSTPGEGPTQQQLLHEASHAQQSNVGESLPEYQERIGMPGDHVQSNKLDVHPETQAQFAEAGIARRSGLNPFRVPAGFRSDTTDAAAAQRAAKETQSMIDAGIHTYDEKGVKNVNVNPNTLINMRDMGMKQDALKHAYKRYFNSKKPKKKKDDDDFFGGAPG